MESAMKGRNFRLSDRTMSILDDLVLHYEAKESGGWMNRNVTRTDVIKKLIHADHARIEDEAKAIRQKAAEVIKESEKTLKANRKAVGK